MRVHEYMTNHVDGKIYKIMISKRAKVFIPFVIIDCIDLFAAAIILSEITAATILSYKLVDDDGPSGSIS